ncbi:MAG: hypothetical protein HQ542_07105, partial [Bacteroidia bacterium]|nr:hypothetical protein [Bacteroidia bacterium]
MTKLPHIYAALPVMDEREWLPAILSALECQGYRNFSVVVCVNQPDEWWDDPSRSVICRNNAESISLLESVSGFPLEVIDKSSRGAGWTGKRHGVGWARKTVMDRISQRADTTDIILSLDADTSFSDTYFESVAETMSSYPQATALTVPYYHRLPEDQDAARAILHYEIYMRYYLLNLWRIRSPYAFTALGSAMAIPVWAYRKVGGMTPKLSGEDFYFLQKLRKAGSLLSWNRENVFPAARFSSRVYFGTGPAMIRGAGGDWGSYPIYSYGLFDEIGESYSHFPEMFKQTVETPVTRFLREQTGEEDPFGTLRDNFRELHQFTRACHEKFDGLRILQYLKQRQKDNERSDEENLMAWFTMRETGNRKYEIRNTKYEIRN